jgi:protein O-mannosyl-transferase
MVAKDAQNPRKMFAVLALLLAVTTAAAYWRTATYGFVRYDDPDYILQNRHVTQGLTWENAKWAFSAFHAANWHPLTWLSHMADIEVFGTWAGGHHLVSLIIHIITAILLMLLLFYTTARLWPAAFVAALFALHPAHVESVAWASERKDVLCGFFWVGGLLMYAFYARKPSVRRYLAVAVFFVLGLLSKPMMVTFPLVLLLFDYWPLERFELRWRDFGRMLLEKIPLFLLAATSCLVTLRAQTGAIADIKVLGLWTRLGNAAISYGRYVLAMVWPFDLALFYPLVNRVDKLQLAAALALIIAVSALAIWLARRHRYILMGWLWYLIVLIPVIGLVQVGTQSHADRYTYLPFIGLFVAIVWVVSDLLDRKPALLKPVFGLAVAVLVLLTGLTYRQVGYWRDDLSLFGRSVLVSRGNPEMLANVGVILAERGGRQEGLEALRMALAQSPHNEAVLVSMATLLLDDGQYQDANEYFTKAIAIRNNNWESQFGMARTQSGLGNPVLAETYCRHAIDLYPETPDTYNLLGIIMVQQNRLDDAIAAFRKAAETPPGIASARLNLARLYAFKGDKQTAIDECRKSIVMLPHPASYLYLAELLGDTGKAEEAEAALNDGIARLPDDASLHIALAKLLEKQGRGADAIGEVEKACKLEPENPEYRDYLESLKGGSTQNQK